jgi:hypothetical protein
MALRYGRVAVYSGIGRLQLSVRKQNNASLEGDAEATEAPLQHAEPLKFKL